MAGRVYSRKDAKGRKVWCADLRSPGYRHRVSCASKADAEKVLSEYNARLRYVDAREVEISVGDVLGAYERHLSSRAERGEVKMSGVRSINSALRRLDALAHLRLDELDQGAWARYEEGRLAEGAAPNTVCAEYGALKASIRHAMATGKVKTNPLEAVRRTVKRKNKRERRPPTREELGRIIAASEPRWARLWALLAGTGMRLGEACALRWRDVETVVDGHLVARVLDAKTRAGRRLVPLSGAVIEALGQRGEPDEMVCPSPRSKAKTLHLTTAQNAFRRAVAAAGIPDPESMVPHVLRYYFATEAFAAGASVAEVKAIGGWSDVSTLLRVYAKASPEAQRRAVEGVSVPSLAEGHEWATGTLDTSNGADIVHPQNKRRNPPKSMTPKGSGENRCPSREHGKAPSATPDVLTRGEDTYTSAIRDTHPLVPLSPVSLDELSPVARRDIEDALALLSPLSLFACPSSALAGAAALLAPLADVHPSIGHAAALLLSCGPPGAVSAGAILRCKPNGAGSSPSLHARWHGGGAVDRLFGRL